MKKILLLAIVCALFSKSFSQNPAGNFEILTKISITKNADAFGEDPIGEKAPYLPPHYKEVKFIHDPTGLYRFVCLGYGYQWCFFNKSLASIRGISQEIMETTCNSLIEDSNQFVLGGEFRGSLSKKIIIEGTPAYYLFQINWDYDPENHRNGQADITIYKVDSFG
jgi:hypothetical protein